MEDYANGGRSNDHVTGSGSTKVCDFYSSPPRAPGCVDEDVASSAAAVVESIVEQVVSFVACKSDFAISNNSNVAIDGSTDCECEEEKLEDIIKLVLNGTAVPRAVSPIKGDEDEAENLANINLDEQGNYLPSVNSNGRLDSTKSSCDNVIDCTSEEAVRREDCTANSNESNVSVENDDDDATNALMQMQILIDENKGLQKEVSKLKHVMQFVMSKYRSSMTFLLKELDIYKNDFQKMIKIVKDKAQFDPKREILNRNMLVAEMKQVMFDAARLNEDTAHLYEEKIARLEYENQGLREIMRIGFKFGSERYSTYADKEVQTEDLTEQSNDGKDDEEPTGTIVKLGETLDVYLNSYEIEEDMDSFHTADSLNGSTLSLNQELDGTSGAPLLDEAEATASQTLIEMVGDQDKVEFDAEKVENVLMEITL